MAREEVDPAILAAQIQALREQIEILQGYLAQITQSRDSVVKAREGLRVVSASEGEVILPLDPAANTLIRVSPVERREVTVHIGLGIFVRTSVEEAIKILEEKEGRLNKAIEEVRRRLREAADAHNRYQLLLQQVLAQRSQQARG